ncbi:hypothetical protein HMPREF2863_10590 [Micrococcus sp. HMSC067E09]|uniref:helicase-related protein n=1 Tax=Micrococcus sp. HMSC067E09 TaxID=1739367 RepID=UPI0008A382DB|nr:helicase-related protein [Micrococcus sp. HMSC067E09]OFR88751.1 hypothetical protein HMPREF2863_10590 [Micrococcus sp. HMSC067E09]
MSARPDVEAMLGTLKPFQRATVEHAFGHLWGEDATDRFLVADEVGLGKTLIAKGVAAKTIERLWERDPAEGPITLVYICSNGQIARQNLARLRDLTGGEVQDNADRLTLLPLAMGRQDAAARVKMLAFTPGTSLRLGDTTGKGEERRLALLMLEQVLGERLDTEGWISFFRAGSYAKNFRDALDWMRTEAPEQFPDEVMARFREAIERRDGGRASLLEDLQEAYGRFWRDSDPEEDVWGAEHWVRRELIGRLRMAMADAAVDSLAPDLVILDEFQRFKDLFDEQASGLSAESRRLAQRVLSSPRTKSLVLSATPYKMYTLPDEPDGEDHYRDFTSTVRFLAGPEEAEKIQEDLGRVRQGMLTRTREGLDAAVAATQDAGARLRRVMCRTERVSFTEGHDGMVESRPLGAMTVAPEDVASWRLADELSRAVDGYDVFELWRSAAYLPNLMDRTGYKVQKNFLESLAPGAGGEGAVATEASAAKAEAVVRRAGDGLLDWESVERFEELGLPNAKLRALVEDLDAHRAWELAWMPPALPYLQPRGVFASEGAQAFTKRLVFSSWSVAPKALSALVSYEAERRIVAASRAQRDERRRYSDKRRLSTLAFGMDRANGVPRNLPNLTNVYPSPTLGRLGDPLALAREAGGAVAPEEAVRVVAERVRSALAEIGLVPAAAEAGDRRRRWYGVAPVLLDLRSGALQVKDLQGIERAFAERRAERGDEEADLSSAMAEHLRWAVDASVEELGDPPTDLPEVLAEMALAGGGVCALRALARSAEAVELTDRRLLRRAAETAVHGLRALFRSPEVSALVGAAAGEATAGASEDAYWRQVLHYSMAGNLQSVLDEYAHLLVESEGLRSAAPPERWEALAARISGVAGLTAASARVEDIRAEDDGVTVAERSLRTHVAVRFGGSRSGTEKAEQREGSAREAYTSPFWPFVLASTSVGQEGLDFHTYSHAVVHWNLPSNPVDLEQREGRVHRYKGHAVRKNLAARFGAEALAAAGSDVWADLFDAAVAAEPEDSVGLSPFWIYPGAAKVWRFVPAMPLSREKRRLGRLQRTLGAYRMVLGQPRQEELVKYAGEVDVDLTIDLRPGAG